MKLSTYAKGACNCSGLHHLVGMGLAPIRLSKRDQAWEQCSGESDGGQPHPY